MICVDNAAAESSSSWIVFVLDKNDDAVADLSHDTDPYLFLFCTGSR